MGRAASMTNLVLYATVVIVWGTSWLAIKYQLGVVAPEASLVYRFVLSAAIMVGYCLASKRSLRFTRRQHGQMALQGLLLFCLNYYLIYLSTQHLTSGLVAVAFSTLSVMSIALGALFYGIALKPRVMAGSLIGLAGIALVFWPELVAFDLNRAGTLGLLLALGGTLSAAFGMMTSGRSQKLGLPVMQTNAWGMVYGSGLLVLLALVRGVEFTIDPAPLYLGSLLFLAVMSTVVGFACYLTLLGRIGPDRAAYATVLFPILALALSTVFEGFRWTPTAAAGFALVLAGNALVLSKIRAKIAAP
jgi:drug/metabolite transporter (DMT)-like permease